MRVPAVVLFAVVYLSTSAQSMNLPPFLMPCKLDSNFNNCMTKHGNLAIPTIIKGDSKWKIPVLEPLSIPTVSIVENSARNVALNVTLHELMIHGLKNAKLVSSKFDPNKKHLEWIIEVPKMTLKSNYKIAGKFLILPIIGSGPLLAVLDNMKLIYNFDFKLTKKNNENYMQITKSDLRYTTTRLRVNFENLFNGNKNLGDATNKLINENWQEFNNQLGPSVARAIGGILSQIMSNIARTVPYDNIFAK